MYNYQVEKQSIFTEEGQIMFLSVRDNVNKLLKMAGACTMGSAISGHTGNSWEMMACVDRLVELGEIIEIPQDNCAGQGRIFVKKY